MINQALINPRSIVVVGASNDTHKPGGKLLKNLLDNQYSGALFAINPKEKEIQGVKCNMSVNDLPEVEMAILAIPAPLCPETMKILATQKNTKAFVVISAGFGELNDAGKELENQLAEIAKNSGATLIGPNCIGVITSNHTSVFTTPIPALDPRGCDFVSGSGATAVFIMESGIPKGLRFSSIFSVGNCAQTGIEEVLEYWDCHFDPLNSSQVKLIYAERISNPKKFLQHASSLVRKGCKIAAIKAGVSEAGSRAASSHTGALATPDSAVDALFRKAGIVRCYSREELATVASVFMYKELSGSNIGIITHAGGPAVMLTDILETGGLRIPQIKDSRAKQSLKEKLIPGSSVENPIDFLATGTAEQLGIIIDACDNYFDEIDAMVVIFGSPGLGSVSEAYELLSIKMKQCKKPIFPVLPSVINAKIELELFHSFGHATFPDEVLFGQALSKVFHAPRPPKEEFILPEIDSVKISRIIENSEDGFLSSQAVNTILDAAAIPRAKEFFATSEHEALQALNTLCFPLAMKEAGPLHKTEVDGISLNIKNKEGIENEFQRLMQIKGATGVIIQEMAMGKELFAGAKYEPGYGHIILCGAGGIFVEILNDVSTGLAPLSTEEALAMIRSLKSYKLFQGFRGKEGVDENIFAQILVHLSALLHHAPEIKELDINPLIGHGKLIKSVDARIKI